MILQSQCPYLCLRFNFFYTMHKPKAERNMYSYFLKFLLKFFKFYFYSYNFGEHQIKMILLFPQSVDTVVVLGSSYCSSKIVYSSFTWSVCSVLILISLPDFTKKKKRYKFVTVHKLVLVLMTTVNANCGV